MPRRKSETLTDSELRIMEVLWKKKSATVADVQKALARHRLAYTTILTTIQVLEQKGYVEHTPQGRAYLYSPTVERQESRRGAIGHLVSRWFDDSPNDLLLNLMEEAELDREELDRLLELARKKRKRP